MQRRPPGDWRWRAGGGAGALRDHPPHRDGFPEVIVADMRMVTIKTCVANYSKQNCEGKITNVFTASSPGSRPLHCLGLYLETASQCVRFYSAVKLVLDYFIFRLC